MVDLKTLPTISVLIPTLNAGKYLDSCLASIRSQNYPKNKIEIIIADGGSKDNTIKIAKKYNVKITSNPLKTAEAGKAKALKKAVNDFVAFIDSDNILPEDNWLEKMVQPLKNSEIIGSEPWEYIYRKRDGFIDRYCALMGMNDPMCYFIGNYDRQNVLSSKWTNLNLTVKDNGSWLNLYLKSPNIPTIGANGTILNRKRLIKTNLIENYLFDIDILAFLSDEKTIQFAKVKVGIIHNYCGSSVKKFIQKQKRRISDYLYYQKQGLRKYRWQNQNKKGYLKFILYCILIFPLVIQSIKGFIIKKDFTWFFHPFACWLTLVIYVYYYSISFLIAKPVSRENW